MCDGSDLALWPVATGQSARRSRPIPPWQQPWVSLGSSPLSRTTEQSVDHNLTHKAGYRDEDDLWSVFFEGRARFLPRARFHPSQLQERGGWHCGAGDVLSAASGRTGGDGSHGRL